MRTEFLFVPTFFAINFAFCILFQRLPAHSFPRGEAGEQRETDEEHGQKSEVPYPVTGLLRQLRSRHSSSVTAGAVPPSPREKGDRFSGE